MRFAAFVVFFLSAAGLSGCAAIAVVDTAVGAATTVVSTTVDVAAGAVDAVAGSKKDKEIDCDDEDNKDEDVCVEKAKEAAKKKAEKPQAQ